MLPRLAALLLLSAPLSGCLVYEYEHEFWLNTDGSGTVHVTGRPALWAAFKGLGRAQDEVPAARDAARSLFEQSGLRVNRVTVTSRGGQAYLFVAADFDDVNRLPGTAAFPDLEISLRREGERLYLGGAWRPPPGTDIPGPHRTGLLAARFHLPSKVYEHRNAADGVERGNILSWRREVAAATDGSPLEFGAVMDDRSILFSTVLLFGGAIVLALLLLAAAFALVARRGRRQLEREAR
jgi:hypothetical protein